MRTEGRQTSTQITNLPNGTTTTQIISGGGIGGQIQIQQQQNGNNNRDNDQIQSHISSVNSQ